MYHKVLKRRLRRRLCAAALILLLFVWFVPASLYKSTIPASATRPVSERLLWSTPRSGGFNNQLIGVYESIRCAQALNRTLVLPFIYENVRNDTSSKGYGPYPFEDYFDVSALAAIVRATTPADLMRAGGPQCAGYVLYTNSAHFYATETRQPRLLKQKYKKLFGFQLKFEPLLSSPEHPELRVNAPCIDDSACHKALFSNPDEFGVYSNYADDGQGYSLRRSARLRSIRSAMQPSETVRMIAGSMLEHIASEFNAVHLRRGDFDNKCDQMPKLCNLYGAESLWQTSEGLEARVTGFERPELPLFVSTTHPDESRELLKRISAPLVFMKDIPIPEGLEWATDRTDIVAFASQIVASHSVQFIANRFSSYSTTINYMRIMRNNSVKLLFF